MKVTKTDIQNLFKQCEKAFDSCWGTLVKLKKLPKPDEALARELISFQEVLAMPLFELQRIRNNISVKEKELIKRKKQYNPVWFKKQMRCLSDYKKGIDHARNIGKGLGDAFAYFFYRNDLLLLEKQFGHRRIDSTITGTGLTGEMKFVKTHKHVGGNLTIYHGTTNILRYGDFSFYDLKAHRIVEIGELKTKKLEENRCELMLISISTKPTITKPDDPVTHEIKMDQSTEARLQKQVNATLDIFRPEKNTDNIQHSIQGSSFAEQLQNLYNSSRVKQHTYCKASQGLLYAATRFLKASLYTRIFNRKIDGLAAKLGDDAGNEVRQLLKSGSADNSIILGNLLYYTDYIDKNLRGTAPLFWYPLSNELLKDLYFGDMVLITIFNPAHILHDLKSKGYNIESKYNAEAPTPGKISISHFDSLITLITNHLQSEETILQMIDSTVAMQNGKFSSIMLRPTLNMSAIFGSPAE